jgi:hypothetical protein
VSIQTLSTLENAIEPYREAGYVITSQTDSAITLRAPAPRFSGNLFVLSLVFMWPLAIYYLFQYNQRKDRSVCVRMTSQGRIEVTGFTLDLLNRDRQRQAASKRLLIVLSLVLLGIICALLLIGLYQRVDLSEIDHNAHLHQTR